MRSYFDCYCLNWHCDSLNNYCVIHFTCTNSSFVERILSHLNFIFIDIITSSCSTVTRMHVCMCSCACVLIKIRILILFNDKKICDGINDALILVLLRIKIRCKHSGMQAYIHRLQHDHCWSPSCWSSI